MTPLRAGFARTDITPQPGLPMEGYGDRNEPAQGVHDRLWGQIMLLEDGKSPVGLVILDLLAVDAAFTGEVRRKIESSLDLPGENFIVAATHTHAGPAGMRLGTAANPSNPEFNALRAELSDKIINLVHQAKLNLQPARLSAAQAQAPRVLANRLDPDGPMDDAVSVLKVEDRKGRLIGVLVNYCGHPTVLNHNNLLYSSDYPHYLRQAVHAELGVDAPVLFINGAAGDVSSRFTRRASTFEEAERIGSRIGEAALQAVNHARPISTAPIKIANHTLSMQMRKIPSLHEARRRLTQAEEKLNRLREQGMQGPRLRLAASEVHGSRAALHWAEQSPLPPIHAHLQTLGLGDLALVTIPGELFVNLGMFIKQNSPFPVTLVGGYANDYIGYIASRQDYDEEGYEVRKTLLAQGAGEQLAGYAVRALKEVREGA